MATTAGGKGEKLSAAKIAGYAYAAGFRGDALVNAIAIALAESGGWTGAHNPNGEDSRGLWQINVAPNVRKNKWGDLTDPAVNARAAFEVSGQGSNFNPWTTYAGSTKAGRNSSYKVHLEAARAGAAAAEGPAGSAAAETGALRSEGGGAPASPGTRLDSAGNVVRVDPSGNLVAGSGALPPDATDQEIEDWIRENYSSVAGFLDNPEMRKLLFEAARGDWDDTKLEAALRETDYFQTHGPPSRSLDLMLAEDPKQAVTLIENTMNTVADLLARNGIEATDEQAGEMAKKAIRAGWINFQNGGIADPARMGDFTAFLLRLGTSPAEGLVDSSTGRAAWTGPNGEAGSASKAEMVAYAEQNDLNPASVQSWTMPDGRTVHYIPGEAITEGNKAALAGATGQKGLPAGEVSFDADGVEALARQYLVPISRSDAEDWALRMMEGRASEESLKSWLNNLAKARFAAQPDIVAALDAGLTPGQFFAGHRETVARLLELDSTQIDLMDPKWMDLIEMRGPDGTRRAPTLGEAAQWARNRPEFESTRAYREQSAGYAVGLSKFFGRAA